MRPEFDALVERRTELQEQMRILNEEYGTVQEAIADHLRRAAEAERNGIPREGPEGLKKPS